MRLSKWAIVVFLVIILAVAAGIIMTRKSDSADTSTAPSKVEPAPVEIQAVKPEPALSVESAETAEATGAEQVAQAVVESPAPAARAAAPSPSVHPAHAPTNDVVLVTKDVFGDVVLATVNGVEIRGADIALFGEASKDKPLTMSEEMIEVLLARAIDRELIRQAAEAEGVVLTADQQSQIDKVAETAQSRVNAPWSGTLQYNGTVEEQTRFEQRESESQMLSMNLLAKRGVAPPDLSVTDDEAKKYYDAHKAEFEALPTEAAAREEAQKALDFQIRNRVAFEKHGVYNAEMQKLANELRGRAGIRMTSGTK